MPNPPPVVRKPAHSDVRSSSTFILFRSEEGTSDVAFLRPSGDETCRASSSTSEGSSRVVKVRWSKLRLRPRSKILGGRRNRGQINRRAVFKAPVRGSNGIG